MKKVIADLKEHLLSSFAVEERSDKQLVESVIHLHTNVSGEHSTVTSCSVRSCKKSISLCLFVILLIVLTLVAVAGSAISTPIP